MENYAELLFQGAVRDLQDADGMGARFEAMYPGRTEDALNMDERAFIAERESFYLASVSETGWPYVQHRGGPRGFLKVLGSDVLGFADYRGNRQYITTGHVATDDRVALFLMDYASKARLKLLGRMTVLPVADAPEADRAALATDGQGRVERLVRIKIIAKDWNCPQFIPDLYPGAWVQRAVAHKMQAVLEENARLKAQIAALT